MGSGPGDHQGCGDRAETEVMRGRGARPHPSPHPAPYPHPQSAFLGLFSCGPSTPPHGLHAGSELGQPGVFKCQAPRFLRRWGSPFTPKGSANYGVTGGRE